MCFNYFFVDATKKIIKQVKYMPSLNFFVYWIRTYVGPTLFEKKEVTVLGEKKIISYEISVIGLIQMNFNHNQQEIDLRFKMSCYL